MKKLSENHKKINFYINRGIIALILLSCVILFVLALSKPLVSNPATGSETNSSSKPGLFSRFMNAKKKHSATITEKPALMTPSYIEVASTKELLDLFDEHDYELDTHLINTEQLVNDHSIEVPALFLSTLPTDFAKNLSISQKKALFIRTLLPLILDANAEISRERDELLLIQECIKQNKALSEKQLKRVHKLAEKYRFRNFALSKLDLLIKRVDVIPVAMALGQAIEETGWGRSYAARIKNATHGVTLPSGVKAYDTLDHSVRAYMLNLNANPAYEKMREIRLCLRSENKELCGAKLMDGLYHYSERRHAYIKQVKSHIRHNKLDRFETYQLRQVSSNSEADTKETQADSQSAASKSVASEPTAPKMA